jgi:hypothetical protein
MLLQKRADNPTTTSYYTFFSTMTSSTTSHSLKIVSNFLNVLDNQKKYNEASSFLDDNYFKFHSPKANLGDKNDWLQRFPEFHKDPPTFEEPVSGAHDNQVTRKGKNKLAMMTFWLVETYELNDKGKIVQISASIRK